MEVHDTQPANFIAGAWKPSTRTYQRENPAKPSEIIAVYPSAGTDEGLEALRAAGAGAAAWRQASPPERARVMQKAASLLEARLADVTTAIAREVGKPVSEAHGEVQRAVDILRYYAGYGLQPQGYVVASTRPHTQLTTLRVPLGVVALITPWNFPIAIPAWKAAPALITGNAIVLKPSSLGPAGALHLADALATAGLPAGVFNVVVGPGTPFGQALRQAADLKAVSFTGSSEVGRHLHAELGSSLVRVQMELGGKNVYCVWDDADLEAAAQQAAYGAFGYAGQKCTATSRVLVHASVYDRFREAFVAATRKLHVGDPLDERTAVGPLIDRSSLDRVEGAVRRAVTAGGRVLAGGDRAPDLEGYFFAPTIIEGLDPGSELAQEEVFGPVVTLHPVGSLDEAIGLANGTRYGLAASVSTRSLAVADAFVQNVQAGLVHVNQPTAGVEYHVPFGGTKESGVGPKEQGWSAIDFFSDWKTAVISAF